MISLSTLASFVSLCIVLALIKIFHKLWWIPNSLQRSMRSQGIRGPPYRLIHGNTKEIMSMKIEAMSKPLPGFSHCLFPRIQPHIHRWTREYGILNTSIRLTLSFKLYFLKAVLIQVSISFSGSELKLNW